MLMVKEIKEKELPGALTTHSSLARGRASPHTPRELRRRIRSRLASSSTVPSRRSSARPLLPALARENLELF